MSATAWKAFEQEAEAEEPQAAAEEPQQEQNKDGMYLVFRWVDGKWDVISHTRAPGPLEAKQAVYKEQFGGEADVTLVAVSERWWRPSTFRIETTERVVVE